MAQIRRMQPHDPLPGGYSIVVMRRFDEDAPKRLMVETIISHKSGSEETARPQRPDGMFMTFEEAIAAASRFADEHGLEVVHVVDRTAGPRERDILRHDGDHSVNMEGLSDDDLEDGEHGPDMRDRR